MNFWSASFSLLRREIVRFLRQRSRIVGALGTPLLFWILIGSGLGKSFTTMNYLDYFFPGTLILILLFTAIFSTISIIEDRHEGFLQGVLVAPVSRGAFVMGKLLGGSILAFVQGLLFLSFVFFLDINLSLVSFIYICGILFIIAFGLTGLGFIIAWQLDSTQGFHSVMNLLLMPMWFLSGALFPLSGAPEWLQWVMKLNPLTYSVAGLHRGLFYGLSTPMENLPQAGTALIVSTGFALLMFFFSIQIVNRKHQNV